SRQPLERVRGKLGRTNRIGDLFSTSNLDKATHFGNGVVVGATGEFAGHASGQPLIQPCLIGVEQGIECDQARGNGNNAGASRPLLANCLDSVGQNGDGFRHGARLANVTRATVEGFVPTVFFGDKSIGGANLFLSHAEGGEPFRQLHNRSSMTGICVLRHALRYEAFAWKQLAADDRGWPWSKNTTKKAEKQRYFNGEGEIRTPATLAGRPVFETGTPDCDTPLDLSGFAAARQPSYVDFLRKPLPLPPSNPLAETGVAK